MRCSDALLAHLQGSQAADDDRRAARSHIARCPDCAGAVEDLEHDDTTAAAILRDLAARHASTHRGLRTGLAAVAKAQLVLAVPWLLGFNPLTFLVSNVGQAHLTRDGAIGLFVGAAGVMTAYRPRYATGAVIISLIGVVAQLVAGAADEHQAQVSAWYELLHLLTLATLVLTAVLAGSRPRLRQPERRRPGLRRVA